jgi:hypothetical protein
MRLISLIGGAVWVDFIVILITKLGSGQRVPFLPPAGAINLWYDTFGLAAVSADVLSAVLGVLIAMFLFPGAVGFQLVMAAIFVQMIHDIFLYFVVIRGLPQGQNQMIDVFKSYSDEGGLTILLADALIMTGTVVIATMLDLLFSYRFIAFQTLLGMYSLIYITYTRSI